ncbi:osmotically inducible protein OsmC [Janibacter sp. Soil728]|uniref:alpha/beta hydrolase family protein n=1 Tax=Janibacter sp. Soil728 TaxID=1736393 RepID=UPI000700B116|nr:alpha/beta fold hydrolase [Janibacter sp. Soil728]KRE37258.1 osmotically inducible protein OsmC [Janibacter sp. Soil728]
MEPTEITFSGTGGETLVGTLDMPPKEPEGYALMAHCFTGGRRHPATRRVSRALCERGLAVLRFDFTGFGDSGGEFAESTFSSNVADIVLAADWLRAHHGAPSLLVGHSLGGAAVIAAAGRIPEVAALATIGAPDDPAHVAHLFASVVPEVEREGRAEVLLGGQRVVVGREFLEDIRSVDVDEQAARLGRPLLILHSPQDEVVELANAEGLYRAAKHPKSFISLDGADHLLTGARDAARAAQLIAAWADPYLPGFTPEID